MQAQVLVGRFFEEVWNQNDVAAIEELVHENYASTENQVFPTLPGREILAADVKLYQGLYADLHFHIDRMLTEGEIVITFWQATGTSKHETFVSRDGATRPKELQAEGISLTEVKDDKIISHRFLWPRDPLFP
jgi:hypothetical protein